jgi:hypothetical protein
MNTSMSYQIARAADLEQLGIRYVPELDNTRTAMAPQARLAETRAAGEKFREQMLNGNRVRFYQTIDLIRVPYPVKYGLLNASRIKLPFMHILNRLYVIQFDSPTGLKTLLFSPSDIEGNRETPYFKRLEESPPRPLRGAFRSMVAPASHDVESALASVGISPERVDYISYDHLHTQDLRRWLGSHDTPGLFPNARLLVMDAEWRSTEALLPPQADWYCPHGIDGIPADKVVMLENSAVLGDGVALVRTPGHTEGNHSLVAHTDEGLLVSSENGVSADSFAPQHSDIPGVRDYVSITGMEVVLNGNTLERGLDQYVSMVLEKTIAGPSPRNPDFFNVVPSSEMTPFWLFPGLKPTFSFGPISYGTPVTEANK